MEWEHGWCECFIRIKVDFNWGALTGTYLLKNYIPWILSWKTFFMLLFIVTWRPRPVDNVAIFIFTVTCYVSIFVVCIQFQIIGSVGTVHSVMDSGDVRVRFGNRTWTINPAALDKVFMFPLIHVIHNHGCCFTLQFHLSVPSLMCRSKWH